MKSRLAIASFIFSLLILIFISLPFFGLGLGFYNKIYSSLILVVWIMCSLNIIMALFAIYLCKTKQLRGYGYIIVAIIFDVIIIILSRIMFLEYAI